MRARDLESDSFPMSDLEWKRETKYCPVKKRVTHELNHVMRQQRLLLKKKEREPKTLPANNSTRLYSVSAEISTLCLHFLVKVAGNLCLSSIYLKQIFSINSKPCISQFS